LSFLRKIVEGKATTHKVIGIQVGPNWPACEGGAGRAKEDLAQPGRNRELTQEGNVRQSAQQPRQAREIEKKLAPPRQKGLFG